MIRFLTLFPTVLVLCIGLPATGIAREIAVGAWTGSAYFDEQTGEFSHCAISAEYGGGDTLVFSITSGGKIVLGVSNPQWRFREGDRYPVYLSVDRRDLGRYEAIANRENAVYIYLAYSEEMIRLLRKGRVLYLEASQETLRYKLTGTSAALPRLQDCVYRELFSNQVAQNPFSSGRGSSRSQNPFGSDRTGSAAPTEDDAETVAMLLREARMHDYRFVPESSRPEYLSEALYVWTNGTVIGSVFAYEIGDFEIGLMTSVVLSGYEESCSGQFTYGIKTAVFDDGTRARRALAQCAERSGDIVMSFLIYEMDEIAIVIVHIGDEADVNAVKAADDSLFRVFSKS